MSEMVVGTGSGNGEKWPEAGFILNFKLIGFLEGLDIKFEDNHFLSASKEGGVVIK